MDTDQLKNVIGEVKPDQPEPAIIRFFGKITEESAIQFNQEFDFLENVIRPPLIQILINSEGGSVLHGMGVYSTILNSRVKTECIIEGMAASMASVIWAAGRKSLMRDYAILMIHNPFSLSEDDNSDIVRAFTKQIETIYRKRFCLSKERIKSIMDGEAGKDGTFFDARSAVSTGIIPAENIIHTPKQLFDKVKAELSGIEDLTLMQEVMSRLSPENKLLPFSQAIPEKEKPNMNEPKTIEVDIIASALGMSKSDNRDVLARITSLVLVESKLAETENFLKDAQTVIAGKEATIQNVQKELDSTLSKLDVYEKKEAAAQKTRIENLVENAVKEGKIEVSSKAQWVTMATSNFDLVESTLHSIPSRDKISEEIAKDPSNLKEATEGIKTAEKIMADKVTEVVGANFKFKKIN